MIHQKFQTYNKLEDGVPIKANIESNNQWNINEDHPSYITYRYNDNYYKIVDKYNNETAARILDFISNWIIILQHELASALFRGKIPKNVYDNVILLVNTPVSVQEIIVGTGFRGINKPKKITFAPNDGLTFALDNEYRAGKRHIMLEIIDKGKVIPWKQTKKLLIHELSHTMCNHCTYRTSGNHKEDFKRCEDFLKKFTSNNEVLENMEKSFNYII